MLGQEPVPCASNGKPDPYIDFFTCRQTGSPELLSWVSIYKAAIEIARKLHSMRFHLVPGLATMESMVRTIKILTASLQQDTPGMHALVWVHSIAAASTQVPENQSFFTGKLRQVHSKTHMHNIVVAVERLEEMWRQRYDGWIARFLMMRPVLAI